MAAKVLKHADGTAVTAQEAHDAFMNTRLLIVKGDTTYVTIGMVWYDNNSAQDDPNNVGYVRLSIVYDNNNGGVGVSTFEAGDSSLAPAGQG